MLAAHGEVELGNQWVAAGADAVMPDARGATPAMVAARRGYLGYPGAMASAAILGLATEDGMADGRFRFAAPRPRAELSAAALAHNQQPDSDGGWDATAAELTGAGFDQLELGRCDVDERLAGDPAVAPGRFFQEYALASRPLIIRGGSRNWDWVQRWRRVDFGTAYGGDSFGLADLPYKSDFEGKVHGAAQETTLANYLAMLAANRSSVPPARPPLYLFESNGAPTGDRSGRAFLADIPDPCPLLALPAAELGTPGGGLAYR